MYYCMPSSMVVCSTVNVVGYKSFKGEKFHRFVALMSVKVFSTKSDYLPICKNFLTRKIPANGA